MSGVYMLFRVVLVIVNYRNRIGWLLIKCTDVPEFIHTHNNRTAL